MANSDILLEMANLAMEYRINLDDSVSRDQTASFQGRSALVYQGTLPAGRVAVKTVLSGPPGDTNAIKVELYVGAVPSV